jgi:tRNA threonylcarbamoyladenosine biosynthesis protein TsaB
MNILAVDTTTPDGSVALLENGEPRIEINWTSPLTHSSRLLRSIDFILAAAGLDIRAVDGFAVAVGPGSFTGIRIGLSAVKSLAFASGKPAAPVSTLAALASKPGTDEGRFVAPLLDAKKGEIYAALFERRKSGLAETVRQGAYDPETFFNHLPARGDFAFIGNGLAVYSERLRALLGGRARFSPRSPFIAAEVGLLGGKMILEGSASDDGTRRPVLLPQDEGRGSPRGPIHRECVLSQSLEREHFSG